MITTLQCFLLSGMLLASGVCRSINQQKAQLQTGTTPPKIVPDSMPKERRIELIDLIGNVQSSSPEFATDLLITIVESGLITEVEWKKDLLEQAFRSAAGCQHQMPQKAVGPYPVDTRAGYMGEAFRLKLDTLSLRCRIVDSMLRLDRAKALELFNQIGKLKLPPVNCDAGLVYDVSDIYKIAAKLFREAFSATETARNEHIRFLESVIDDVSSPIQVAPVASMIRSLAMSLEQKTRLVSAFASRIAQVSGDDRSFSGSAHLLADEMGRLIYACNKEGAPTGELIRALRSFYVRHFSGNRCSDTLRSVGDTGPLPRVVNDFNNRLRDLTQKNIAEIEIDELKPSRIEGKVEVHFFWQSPRSQKLMARFKRLKFGSGAKPLSSAEMDTIQWKADLREFLAQLSAWDKGDEDSAEDYFHQKCNLFEALLNSVLPAGPERNDVSAAFLTFLSRFDLMNSVSRIEWFWHAKNLLPRGAIGEGTANVKTLLDSSNNAVLYTYIRVWKMTSSEPKRNRQLPN